MNFFLIEDSLVERNKMRRAIEETKLSVVGEAESVCRAVNGIVKHMPEVVVINLNIFEAIAGIEFIQYIRQLNPGTLILVFSNAYPVKSDHLCVKGSADHFFVRQSNDFCELKELIARLVGTQVSESSSGRLFG